MVAPAMWFAAGALVSAASSIIGGMSSASAAEAQAERARRTANYNAAMQKEWGKQQAAAIAAATIFNTQMAVLLNSFNKEQIKAISKYNAGLVRDVSEYNAQLYEQKTSEIYDALELDQLLVTNEAHKQQGSAIAQYAASGVIISEGSPANILMDMQTQEALTKFILTHNADVSAKDMLNAAAKSRWEGEVEARKILFEGRMNSIAMDMNTAAKISMSTADSMMGIVNVQNTAYMRSIEILSQGTQTSDALEYDASRYMFNGFLQAGTSMANAYFGYKSYMGSTIPAFEGPTAGGFAESVYGPNGTSGFGASGYGGPYALPPSVSVSQPGISLMVGR